MNCCAGIEKGKCRWRGEGRRATNFIRMSQLNSSRSRSADKTRWLTGLLLLAGLVVLIRFSLRIAFMRIYQVDECAEIYTSRLLALGEGRTLPGGLALLQIPLSWLAGGDKRAEDIFTSARFVMVEIFWLNVFLMALATGEKLRSVRGLVALLAAATIAPLWDYGLKYDMII